MCYFLNYFFYLHQQVKWPIVSGHYAPKQRLRPATFCFILRDNIFRVSECVRVSVGP